MPSARAPLPRHTAHGFTLVELIVVMVIVGVLGAIAAARFFDRATYDTAAYAEQLRALIRYGQKVAVAQNRPVFVRLDGNSVALCFTDFSSACAVAERVMAASGSNSGSSATALYCAGSTTWACEGGPQAITYSVAPARTVFSFDALGRPVALPAGPFARTVLTIGAGADARTVTIEQETGYVR